MWLPSPVMVLATLIGVGLVVFPEPATTATGLVILGATWGPSAARGISRGKR